MTAPALSRTHLEALLVASLIVRPDVETALALIDPLCLSTSARALLEQLTAGDDDLVRTATKGQAALADRVEAITIGELLDYSLETLVGLLNALPVPAVRPVAWERDLARGLEGAA